MSESKTTKNEDITIRKLLPGDDRLRVAELIYLTDEYIYPSWFDSEEEAFRVLSEMISLDTIYNDKNITVAELPN